MAKQAEKTETKYLNLPPGRIINMSLFEKDQFKDDASPSYKLELAFTKDPDVLEDGGVFAAILEALAGAFTEPADGFTLNIDGGPYVSGILDGDKLAAKREAAGKVGDAYKNMWVIRSSTQFNKNGDNAAGGIAVYDEDVKEISAVNQSDIYRGCCAVAKVSIKATDIFGSDGVTFYLSAVQKVADGERLTSPVDHAGAFKPVGRKTTTAAGAQPVRSKRGQAKG